MSDNRKAQGDAFARALVGGLNRNVTIEAIMDEMARRQGEHYGPMVSWDDLTEEFRVRFTQAYAAKPAGKDCDEFAREFVDQWPEGVGAVRLDPAETLSSLARPPYAKDGLWPAFLRK